MKKLMFGILVTALVALVIVPTYAQVEMISNGGFETWTNGPNNDPDDWLSETSGISARQEGTIVHGGNYSAKLKLTSSTETQRFTQVISGITAGNDYTFSFYALDNDTTARARVCIRWYDNVGGFISGYYGSYTSDNPAWQQLSSGAKTAPAGAVEAHAEIRLYDTAGFQDSAFICVDDASFLGPSGDTTPPTVNIAFATGQTGLDVHFSEAVDETSSENAAHYTLTSGLAISDVSRDVSDLSIVHLTTGNQTNGLADTLIVNGVADTSSNTMTIPDTVAFREGFTPISMIQTPIPPPKDGDQSQLLNEIVTITGIVTADTSTYSHYYVYIQDGDGTWSGIKAHFTAWGALEGDSVTVAGQVIEYYGETEVEAQGVYYVVNSSGHELPPPVVVHTGDVATGSATAESYEGVLIQVSKAWVTNDSLGHGEWEICDGPWDSCMVGHAAEYSYTPELGDTVSVIGVLRYAYGNFRIDPRYDADIDTTIVGVRVSDLSAIPGSFSLSQNYPNPFNPTTQITFSLPTEAQVRLTIYNIVGQKVAELVNEKLDAGSYRVNWDAKSFTSGVYFYRIEAGKYRMTRKMVLLK